MARIVELRDQMGLNLRQIAKTLNENGVAAKRSDRWHPMKVKRVLDRATR